MKRVVVGLVLALITFVASEPVRILPANQGPKVYVSPEDAPNQFIMEDSSQVEGLAQVKDEPITPYYTGPALHGKKGTPGAAFIAETQTEHITHSTSQAQAQAQTETDSNNHAVVAAQMVPTDVLNDPQSLWDLKGAVLKHNEQNFIANGNILPADSIPGFNSLDPVMVPVLSINQKSPTAAPSSATTTTTTDSDGVVEADVVALEKQAKIEEDDLRELRAKIVERKQAHVTEKQMKFKEKLENLQQQRDAAITKIKEQAALQEKLILEQAAEEATRLAQEQKDQSEKREPHPLPMISLFEESSDSNTNTNTNSDSTTQNKVVRMREVIQAKKDLKKKEKDDLTKKTDVDTNTDTNADAAADEEEKIREGRASAHLRNTITSSLAEEANAAEARAHHEADMAHQELEQAVHEQDGWSTLRTATHHIEDAAAYLKQKDEAMQAQEFVISQAQDGSPTENTSTTVSLVDPATVIDESSLIQVNGNVMRTAAAKPARALMAKIKQMKASTSNM